MYQSFLVHWGTFLTGTSWESYLAYCQPSLGRLKKTTEEMIDERQKPWIHGCNKPPMLRGVMWWVLFIRWGKTLWPRVCSSSTLEQSQVSSCMHSLYQIPALRCRGCVNVCQLKGESRVFCFEYLCQKRRMGVLLGHGTKLYVPYTSM